MFSFMKSLVGVKVNELGNDITRAIVEMDPDAASAAQLDQMEQDLNKAGAVIQKLRVDYDREVREYESAKKRYDQMMGAAEVLQRKLDDPATTNKADIETSLTKLVAQLEEQAPIVESEHKDVEEVKAMIDQAQEAYREKAAALTSAKQNLERTKRDMQRAIQQEERAEEKAARAAEVAGLRGNSVSGLNVATEAMQRRADEAKAKAEAATLKANTLTGLANPVAGDDIINAALKEASGNASSGSLAERLAKLKK